MDVSRRAFFKTGIIGAAGITVFGFDAQPLMAQAASLKDLTIDRDAQHLPVLFGELRRHHPHHR